MENNELKSTILLLEELLKIEKERADRNYEAAAFFENLYDTAIDWFVEMENADNG